MNILFIINSNCSACPDQVYTQNNGQRRIKLGDFGLAKIADGPLFTVCGTPTYVAPEILEESGYG